jgi:hypothetical protein
VGWQSLVGDEEMENESSLHIGGDDDVLPCGREREIEKSRRNLEIERRVFD